MSADLLQWRGVETPCTTCGGSGVRVYGSTSTWRGGMGGASMTADVCDSCWGSGDLHKPWTNLRRIESDMRRQVAERSVDILARSVGATLRSTRPALLALLEELDNLSSDRKRKPRPSFFREIVHGLMHVLKDATAEGPHAVARKDPENPEGA